MVSSLYRADAFYEKQKKGNIASSYNKNMKLQQDTEGFFVTRSKSNGDLYKQRVAKNDLVYTRAETGVTKYSKALDYDKKSYGVKESVSKHNKHAHMSDLETSTGKVRRV